MSYIEPPDFTSRERAIDPTQSFIVQAPAGSGKTEILTQRYLKLLSTVNAPEQIIALTFTRKAANEMRERILMALQRAANQMEATSAHQQKTFQLAHQALARDAQLNWGLLQQPQQLRIMTIDALCQMLAQAIPLLDPSTHQTMVTDSPRALYLQAAQNCLQFAAEQPQYQSALKRLLQHVDNRQNHLLTLFCDMLAKRDQWLSILYQARGQEKNHYEVALALIQQHALLRFQQTMPVEYADQLITLLQQFSLTVSHYPALQTIQSFAELSHEQIQQLTALLLTSQQTLRKAFDHHVGLKRGQCRDEDYVLLKTTSQQLFADLAACPDFLPALIRLQQIPHPKYDPLQWQTLQALFALLPLLVAQLNVIFNAEQCVDFIAIAQQAAAALGDEAEPTDLALYLDNQIQHLLIDEFQDTSLQQFHLLQQLLQGWQPHDGRSLFVVGDPMQSIYRFRGAEVGLFLRTQQFGIGPVKLIPLQLSCNFRSTAGIVDWINHQFQAIFPQNPDIESGAVAFHPSTTLAPAAEHEAIWAYACSDLQQEAHQVLHCIHHELQTNPQAEIAILVRSRHQLSAIIPLLRQYQIPFQGVDIDLLTTLPHLRDVWSLTQVLLMPAHRLAWLAFLRSPWCGLNLQDLHCIANHAKQESIFVTLARLEQLSHLSPEGRTRAQFIYQVFQQAYAKRHQQALVDWILETLTQLHLQHILNSQEQEDLEQYWQLLERYERAGLITDLALFQQEFNQLYSKQATPARLQIMTIHKSKGLEFDCVMLPGLGAQQNTMDTPLLRWLKLPTEHTELLLLSPLKSAQQEQCPVYDYLAALDHEKNLYEAQRLLYVATTRAKARLYLFDGHTSIRQGSLRHFLHQQAFTEVKELDPAAKPREVAPPPTSRGLAARSNGAALQQLSKDSMTTSATINPLPPLLKLPLHLYQQPLATWTVTNNLLPSRLADHTQRYAGLATHALLQWMCDHHPTALQQIPWQLAHDHLRQLGCTDITLTDLLTQIQYQIQSLWADPIGQWLLQPHQAERNEYALLLEESGIIKTRIIDRTFIEHDQCWIIDFKTGQEEPHHRQQVSEYAQLFATRIALPIQCGLYYLATNRWVPWEYSR